MPKPQLSQLIEALDLVDNELGFQIMRLSDHVHPRHDDEASYHEALKSGYETARRYVRILRKYHEGRSDRQYESPIDADLSARGSAAIGVTGQTSAAIATVEPPLSYPKVLLPFKRKLPQRDADWLSRVNYSTPTFRRWVSEPRPSDTKGGKPLIDWEGEPCFAELGVLNALTKDGWLARWIDNFPMPPTFRTRFWTSGYARLSRDEANEPLPDPANRVYQAICKSAGDSSGGGAWDILAWRGNELLFVECKRKGAGDRIRATQIAWLDAALKLGIPAGCFVFAEWSSS